MGTDATKCSVCGGEFSTRRVIIEGKAVHQGCSVMSYPPHTSDDMARLSDALERRIARLRGAIMKYLSHQVGHQEGYVMFRAALDADASNEPR